MYLVALTVAGASPSSTQVADRLLLAGYVPGLGECLGWAEIPKSIFQYIAIFGLKSQNQYSIYCQYLGANSLLNIVQPLIDS